MAERNHWVARGFDELIGALSDGRLRQLLVRSFSVLAGERINKCLRQLRIGWGIGHRGNPSLRDEALEMRLGPTEIVR